MVVQAGELAADLLGVRVLQILEDGQRLLPGLPDLAQLADGVAGVAEVRDAVCFKPGLARVRAQAE